METTATVRSVECRRRTRKRVDGRGMRPWVIHKRSASSRWPPKRVTCTNKAGRKEGLSYQDQVVSGRGKRRPCRKIKRRSSNWRSENSGARAAIGKAPRPFLCGFRASDDLAGSEAARITEQRSVTNMNCDVGLIDDTSRK